MQAKNKFAAARGPGRREAELKRYSVVYIKRSTPAETRIEAIFAPDIRAAHQMASRLFADCIILRIRTEPAPVQSAEYPGARFINGRFQPVMS